MSYLLHDVSMYEFFYELQSEILEIPLTPIKPASGHSGTGYKAGWIGDLSTTQLTYPDVGEPIYRAIDALNSELTYDVAKIMVNRLGPQSCLAKHRDGKEDRTYRFHLPVITNPQTYWWDEISKNFEHFMAGYWYGPIPYQGVLHTMANLGNSARYHLIVDLKAPK